MSQSHLELVTARSLADPLERFRALSEIYAALAGREHVKILPYQDPSLKVFSRLTPAEQAFALENMNLSLDVFLEVLGAQGRLLDSPQLLWRTLRKLGLTPASDIFDKIADGDIVEIYSIDNRQIFRNLKFFEFVSMSLEEVYSNRWYEFTRRPPHIEQQLYSLVQKIASGELKGTFPAGVDEHVFDEVGTAGLFKTSLALKWIAPVTSGGKVVGLISTNRARVLSGRSA